MYHKCGGNIEWNEDKGCYVCDHCEIETMQPERSKREDLTSISEPSERCKEAMAKIFWS